jgi:photosystem II oxygen-evolving enhancer protein 2
VAVQGQDKVYKDVIEPLESVSINSIPTSKEDIRDLGPPDKVNLLFSLSFFFKKTLD